jgi:D-alanyl-D-alanine carboxypeptidase
MRRFLLLLAVLPLAACSSSASPSPGPAPAPTSTAPPVPTDTPPAAEPNALADAIDALFTDAETKDAFSGSVIVTDGGKQVLEKSYGFADRTSKRKNTPDTLFRIASVSKQFAASAILALVQDGALALTDPVSKFFPDYPKESLVKDGVEVTLHHLISHTSGLPNPRATEAFKKIVWRRAILPTEQIDFVKAEPLVSAPGSAYEYVNYNFLLAALVVEKTSGQTYEAFLKKRFFAPLAMKDTGTLLPAADAPRAAVGYAMEGGELTSFADDSIFQDDDVTFAFGSGQIYSTVRDLAKWDRALNGEAVLKAPQRGLLFKANLDDYGYGWVIQKKGGVSMAWHNGAISPLGFTSLIVRVPSKDRFVAYLSNMDLPLVQPFEAKVTALVVK